MKARLTKRVVEGIEPGESDRYCWDTELIGFTCKVTPKGRRVYLVQYKVHGRTRRYTIGSHGKWTCDMARKEAVKVLALLAEGKDPAEMKRLASKVPTFSKIAERYMEEYAKPRKKPLSIAADERSFRLVLLPAFGRRKVDSITRADVVRLQAKYSKEPVKWNRAQALLSKCMNLAETWGYRPDNSNPCRHVEKFKERGRERYLSETELGRLGEVLNTLERTKDEWPTAILALRLLILTGLRKSEVINLQWGDVDFERGLIFLRDSKTGARALPVSLSVLKQMENAERIEGNDYIIWGLKEGRPFVGLQKVWERVRAKVGIEDVRLHDLRHTAASLAAGQGVGLLTIGGLLGHKVASTTKRYSHLADHPLRKAAEQVAQEALKAMNGKTTEKVVNLSEHRSK